MTRSAQDYLSQLQALLPSGDIWPRGEEAFWTGLLSGVAAEMARVDARAAELLEEAFPDTAIETLSDWERAFGLPDPCVVQPDTIQERRAALIARITARPEMTIASYVSLAAALGYAITIEEFKPFTCGVSQCGDPLNGPGSVRSYWRVTVPGPRLTLFQCGVSQCGDSLGDIDRAEDLECLFRRLKPSDTNLIVAYTGV